MRFQFIKPNRSLFPMKKMCLTLRVSMSGYYAWCSRPKSQRQQVNMLLRKRIAEIFNEHGGMIGSPVLTSELRDEPLFRLPDICVRWGYAANMQRDLSLQQILRTHSQLLLICSTATLLRQLLIWPGSLILRTSRLDESGIT